MYHSTRNKQTDKGNKEPSKQAISEDFSPEELEYLRILAKERADMLLPSFEQVSPEQD